LGLDLFILLLGRLSYIEVKRIRRLASDSTSSAAPKVTSSAMRASSASPDQRLPLHVPRRVRSAAGERHDVISPISRTRAGGPPGRAAGQRGAGARRGAAREPREPARRIGGNRACVGALQQRLRGKKDSLSQDADDGNKCGFSSASRRAPAGIVKLAESGLGRSQVGRVNGRDEDASRLDLRRPSLPR
jgi:hypothetical protein